MMRRCKPRNERSFVPVFAGSEAKVGLAQRREGIKSSRRDAEKSEELDSMAAEWFLGARARSGNLSLSAGETIRFTSGFHVDTGTLTVSIDPLLAP